jgi:RimJ/RimL family protein N-acetyltransferase
MTTRPGRSSAGSSGGYYLAFKSKLEELALDQVHIPAGFQMRIWRPRLARPLPPVRLHRLGNEKMLTLPSLVFFYLNDIYRGVPHNYKISIATNESQQVIGFVVLRGGDFRFPFMDPGDVQLGPVWIADSYRGRGLAVNLCRLILLQVTEQGSNVWWLCRRNNKPSQAVARKLLFRLECAANRSSLLGLPAPHIYTLRPMPDAAG